MFWKKKQNNPESMITMGCSPIKNRLLQNKKNKKYVEYKSYGKGHYCTKSMKTAIKQIVNNIKQVYSCNKDWIF